MSAPGEHSEDRALQRGQGEGPARGRVRWSVATAVPNPRRSSRATNATAFLSERGRAERKANSQPLQRHSEKSTGKGAVADSQVAGGARPAPAPPGTRGCGDRNAKCVSRAASGGNRCSAPAVAPWKRSEWAERERENCVTLVTDSRWGGCDGGQQQPDDIPVDLPLQPPLVPKAQRSVSTTASRHHGITASRHAAQRCHNAITNAIAMPPRRHITSLCHGITSSQRQSLTRRRPAGISYAGPRHPRAPV